MACPVVEQISKVSFGESSNVGAAAAGFISNKLLVGELLVFAVSELGFDHIVGFCKFYN